MGVQEDGCQYRWEGKGDNMRWELIPGTCNTANTGINNNARFGNIGLGVSAGINLDVNAGINLGFNGAGSSSGDNCERRWISKPRQQCSDVPRQECNNVPTTQCQQVQDQECTQVPRTVCDEAKNNVETKCELVHKKVPVRVSRKVPKTVCGNEGGAEGSFGGNGGVGGSFGGNGAVGGSFGGNGGVKAGAKGGAGARSAAGAAGLSGED